jgi:lipopolysaccharide/colanic/teichoic acid biosynthesis glycosyltransferase
MTPSDHPWTDPSARIDLMEELYQRFAHGNSLQTNARLYWKKYAWLLVVRGTTWVKRVLDITVAVAAGLLLLPLFAVVAIAVKLTDRGPVLFWQTRVGKWGKEFPFPKFRSMLPNAESLKTDLMPQSDHGGQSITFKMKRDPRVTWIGRIIRKLSIDELPQLWCVIKGDMSLVGPRPPTVGEVAQYTLADRRRLDVIPGLTCIWQVSGRGDIPFQQQLELDLNYIQSRSLRLDLIILIKTIPAVLLGRGAY